MIQDIKDEILENDPRYRIRDNNGNIIQDNINIEQITPVAQEGTPINRATLGNIQGDLYTQDRYNELIMALKPVESGVLSRNLFDKLRAKNNGICENSMVRIEASSTHSNSDWGLLNAFDGDNGSTWYSEDTASNHYVLMTFVEPIKLIKLKTYISCDGSLFTSAIIQGSNDNASWADLYTISAKQTTLTDIELANPNYYLYYRIYYNLSGNTDARLYEFQVTEWEGTYYEYVANLSLPLTSYEKGKILNIEGGRLAKEAEQIAYNTNIFPTTWSEVTAYTEYVSADGFRITASSANDSSVPIYCAFDNSTNTQWQSLSAGATEQWAKIEVPYPTKITKIKLFTLVGSDTHTSTKIQGSHDNNQWVDLYETPNATGELKELTLNNTDFYKYYRVFMTIASGSARIKEIQTSECIVAYSAYYIENFKNVYLSINNLEAKKINGTIYADNQYSLMYNGESWDVFPQKKLIFEKVLDIATPNITISGLRVRKGQKLSIEIHGRADDTVGLQINPSDVTQEYYYGSSSTFTQSASLGRLDLSHDYVGLLSVIVTINPVDRYPYILSEYYKTDTSNQLDWSIYKLRQPIQEINELKLLGYFSNPTQTSYEFSIGTIIKIWQE